MRFRRGAVVVGTLFAIGNLFAIGACAPDYDQSTSALIENSDEGLSAFDSIDRLATQPNGTIAYVSGNLSAELSDVAAVFDVDVADLALARTETDSLGFVHQRFTQTRDGLRIVSGDLAVTRNEDGVFVSASGAAWNADELPAEDPSIDAADAERRALASTVGANAADEAELVYLAPSVGGSPVLAWVSRVRGQNNSLPVVDDVFVDAVSGEVIERHPQVHTVKNRLTYDAENTETLGTLARGEGAPATGDLDVDNAHQAAGETHDCLQTLFGRDSYDGLGASLSSIAHFGVNFENAGWSDESEVMIYGDGFAAIDVGTHEMGHAVTSRTAGLVYQNESGALNEAVSDIMSAICHAFGNGGAMTQQTWLIGEDLAIGPLRDMTNPTVDGISTDHYLSRYQGTEDNGGVHLNSGIANLQFVLMVNGGSHPKGASPQVVTAIGMDDAAQIMYRALTTKMVPNTTFLVARTAYEDAAGELFGIGSAQQVTVSEAFAAVGVGGEPPPQPEPEPEQETGNGDNLEGGCNSSGSGAPSGLLVFAFLGLLGFYRRRA